MDNAEQIFRMLSYVATPIVAVAAVIIARQQADTSVRKLDLDAYERRLRVYEEVKKLLSIVITNGQATFPELLRFRTAVSEADFLYPPEVMKYLDELYSRGVDLGYWRSEYRDYTQPQPPEYDHAKVVAKSQEQIMWFSKQYEASLALFKKHLSIAR